MRTFFIFKEIMNVQSVKFVSENENSANIANGINLLYLQFNVFDFLPKNFTIFNLTNKKTYLFNDQMLKNTSSVISQFIENNIKKTIKMQFQISIEDYNNVMGKVEHLYIGEKIEFSKNDLLVLRNIIKQLNLNCFPSSIDGISEETNIIKELKLVIDKNSMINFLQCKIPNSFIITTNKTNYKCNCIGINSSNILNKIGNNNQLNYKYNFHDSNYDFTIISNFFNFKTININFGNVKILKKISTDLQIKCLLKEIDSVINTYENIIEIINEKQPIVNNINELIEYLYNRKNVSAEATKNFLIQSFWCQTEENIQELVAYIVQVIHTKITLHPFLMDLLLLLDKSSTENLNTKKIIPFLSQKLMQVIGYNKLNCAFIHRLYKKGFITKEEIVEEIIMQLSLTDSTYENENITSSGKFLNEYLRKFNKDFDTNDRINNMLVWFFCELIEIKKIPFDTIINTLDRNHANIVQLYYPNNFDEFKKMRENYEPNDEITKALKYDDVEKVKKNIPKSRFGFAKIPNKEKVPFNIFESYVQNGITECINYAAAYGSMKCFEYLLSKYSSDDDTLCYAIYGQNKEIFQIAKQNRKNIPCDKCTLWNNELFPSVMTHQNDIFDIFFEDKNIKYDLESKELFNTILMNGNIHSFVKMIENGFDLFQYEKEDIAGFITIAAKNGFNQLTHLIFLILQTNKDFLFNLLQLFPIENLFSFGNISMVKLLSSLDIKNVNFENALAISVIQNYFNIIEYSFEYYYSQKFELTSIKALNLIKLSAMKKKPDIFKYLTKLLVGLDKVIKEFPDRYDDKILLYACEYGNFEVLNIVYDLIERQKNSDRLH